jgi:hypothetical protein
MSVHDSKSNASVDGRQRVGMNTRSATPAARATTCASHATSCAGVPLTGGFALGDHAPSRGGHLRAKSAVARARGVDSTWMPRP